MKIIDVLNSPWAISPKRLIELQSIYRAHFHGEKIDAKVIRAKKEASAGTREGKPYTIIDGTAIIHIIGVLNKNDAFMAWLYDGSTMQDIGNAYLGAVADPAVKAVLLMIDSPGGTVDGTQELANLIYNNKRGKPVIAYSDGMIASAAYWIASAADKIFISGDTVEVGSIGVVATHIDISKQDEQFGEKWTEITAGRYKRIVSAHAPLTDEGRQYLQDQVDHIYTVFVQEVARNRNVSEEQALAMADGKIFIGRNAVDVGLVDGVSTIDQIIINISSGAMMINEEEKQMDLNTLKEKHPDLYQEAIDIGRTDARAAMEGEVQSQVREAMLYGAALENERIRSILAQAVPGHAAIVQEAIADGKSTAGDVALKIVAAEKAIRQQKTEDVLSDTKGLQDVDTTTTVASVNANLPVEERAKAEWDKDPAIRAEFGTLERYVAYTRAAESGRARILGRKDLR